MSIAYRSAAYFVDRYGLPVQFVKPFAELIPSGHPEPVTFLADALTEPTHAALLPLAGDRDALILRLLLLAMKCYRCVDIDWEEKELYEDDLVAASIAGMAKAVDDLHELVRDIPAFVYSACEYAMIRQVRFLRLYGANEVATDGNGDDSEQIIEYPSLLVMPQTEVEFTIEDLCRLYHSFYQCVRTEQQRAILEARWRHPNCVTATCAYATDIAADLNLSLWTVVEELEELQIRYLQHVNDRRRSRNNRRFPALKERPIHRIHRPQLLAA